MNNYFNGIISIITVPTADNFLFVDEWHAEVHSKMVSLMNFVRLWAKTNKFLEWVIFHMRKSIWTQFAERFEMYYSASLELACMQNYNLRRPSHPVEYAGFAVPQRYFWAFYPIVSRFPVAILQEHYVDLLKNINDMPAITTFSLIFTQHNYTMALWKDLLAFFNSPLMMGPELVTMLQYFKEDTGPNARLYKEIRTYYIFAYQVEPTMIEYLTIRDIDEPTVSKAIAKALEQKLIVVPTIAAQSAPKLWENVPDSIAFVEMYRKEIFSMAFFATLDKSWVGKLYQYNSLRAHALAPIPSTLILDDVWSGLLHINDHVSHLFAIFISYVIKQPSSSYMMFKIVLADLIKVNRRWKQWHANKQYREIYDEAKVFWRLNIVLHMKDIHVYATRPALFNARAEEYYEHRFNHPSDFLTSSSIVLYMEKMLTFPDYVKDRVLFERPEALEFAINQCIDHGLIADERGETFVADWYLVTKTAKTITFHHNKFRDWMRVSFDGSYVYSQPEADRRMAEIDAFFRDGKNIVQLEAIWEHFFVLFNMYRDLILHIIEANGFRRMSYSESVARDLTLFMSDCLTKWRNDLLNDRYEVVYRTVMKFWNRQLHFPGGIYQIDWNHLHFIDHPVIPSTPPPLDPSTMPAWFTSHYEGASTSSQILPEQVTIIDDIDEEDQVVLQDTAESIYAFLKKKEEDQYKIFVPLDDPEPLLPEDEIEFLYNQLLAPFQRKRLFRED